MTIKQREFMLLSKKKRKNKFDEEHGEVRFPV